MSNVYELAETMDKNKNIVPHNMQQTLDGSIKSITSGSKLSILQESKEKLNKRIEETLKDIDDKDKKIKELEAKITTKQYEFRGNQHIRGSHQLISKIVEGPSTNAEKRERKQEEAKEIAALEKKIAVLQERIDKVNYTKLNDERGPDHDESNDPEFVMFEENCSELAKLRAELKMYKANDSNLTNHEKELFKLKEVEKESNKQLQLQNRIFDKNQEMRTKINEVRKELIYQQGQKVMLADTLERLVADNEDVAQKVNEAKETKRELKTRIMTLKREVRDNQASLEKDQRKQKEMREQGFKPSQSVKALPASGGSDKKDNKKHGKFQPKDGNWEKAQKEALRGKQLAKMRKSVNSLNNMRELFSRNKEEDFMLGVDKTVEESIEKQNKNQEEFKQKSHTFQKELKEVENQARVTKQEKDKLRNQFKDLQKNTNNEGEDVKDDAKKLDLLKQQISNINDDNYSHFKECIEYKTQNTLLDRNHKNEDETLNLEYSRKEAEKNQLNNEVKKIEAEQQSLEGKMEMRMSHMQELKLIQADAISTVRNMIKYMNITVDSKSHDISGKEGEINHENILVYLEKIEDKVTELVIRRNRQTKQDPPELARDDATDSENKNAEPLRKLQEKLNGDDSKVEKESLGKKDKFEDKKMVKSEIIQKAKESVFKEIEPFSKKID